MMSLTEEMKMPNNKQDIRIIQLARWQIPKTKSVLEHTGDATYLSIGYFDMIDASQVIQEKNIHPLLAAYGASRRHPDRRNSSPESMGLLSENYTVQELLLFTNVGNGGFSDTEISAFWSYSSPVMFISLIHIDNASRIHDIILKIKSCFAGRKYLYYFSFDYSGIILLAKGMELKSYLTLMFRLNYENEDGEKLIRDSYSFYGFHKAELKKIFDALDGGIDFEQAFDGSEFKDNTEQFAASVNIGVQNYNIYQKFLKKVQAIDPAVEEYGLLGRHDISLVNREANLKWLIYVQYLLDHFTKSDSDAESKQNVCSGHMFSTHETFVKVKDIGIYKDSDLQETNSGVSYEKIKENLDTLCNRYLEKLKQNEGRYNGEYGIPITAVKDSILSILKNRFAEDFVLCMYQSFCEFVGYLEEKMDHEDDDVEKFDDCFSDYFRGLNSLVNSAMHSERQFIQATAFNAIIYDVPSKIMAFYVALIDNLQDLMRSHTDKRYTFLLTPSFSNEISVRMISYSGEKPPHDRILMVSINERSLYNPKAVIRRMAHEVAHFAGDDLRNRVSRKKHIKLSTIYIILSHILHGSFLSGPDFFDLIESIEKILSANVRFSDSEDNYSEELLKVIPDIADEFEVNDRIKELLEQYIKKMLASYLEGKASRESDYQEERENLWRYILQIYERSGGMPEGILEESYNRKSFSETQLEILTKFIYHDLTQEVSIINRDKEYLMQRGRVSQSVIARVGSGILKERPLGEYIRALNSAYSEAFADVQMVLLTGLTYEAYLEGFVNEENMDVGRWDSQLEDSARISMVVFALRVTGVWSQPSTELLFLKNSEEVRNRLLELHDKIEMQILLLKNSISDETKAAMDGYFAVAGYFANADSYASVEMENIWQGAGAALGDNVQSYINEHLLIYLAECIEKSVKRYQSEIKIKYLRETINTVSDFEDVGNVFTTICNKLEAYKKKIFPQTSTIDIMAEK